jgi:hypothetical protein
MNKVSGYGIPEAIELPPLPYASFSDESIQESIVRLNKDSKTLTDYAIRKGGRSRSIYGAETQFSIATLPLDIQLLLDKYDSKEGYLFSLADRIDRRVRELENYLGKSKNARGKSSYIQRSDPNGELKVMNIPRNNSYPYGKPMVVKNNNSYPYGRPMAVASGSARRRHTRRHKKSHKKSRRLRYRRR